MFVKSRYEPEELKMLTYLEQRMDLSVKAKQHLFKMKKGFDGEVMFDNWLAHLPDDRLILCDLLLEHQQTFFQIDALVISEKTIFMFEVKNYEGDFYVNDDIWCSVSGNEIKNPLHQLKRNESLLRRFLQHLDYNFPIQSYLVFINTEFTLYQAPLHLPIVFPSQLKRFMSSLNTTSSKLSKRHFNLAEQIVEKHISNSPYSRMIDCEYDFQTLKKGIICKKCNHFISEQKGHHFICTVCHTQENIRTAILRNVEEYSVLFPKDKITTTRIHTWCDVVHSKKIIQRTLAKKYKKVGHGILTYYVKN